MNEETMREDYEELLSRYDELLKRYGDLRALTIEREQKAALIASQKTMIAYRKSRTLGGKKDPLEVLRPRGDGESLGIRVNLDGLSYRKDELVLRGWAYDIKGFIPEITLRDRSRILPTKIRRYPRSDVNELFAVPFDTCTGFTVIVSVKEIRHTPILLEFVNEFGYLQMGVDVLLDEKEREAYVDKNAAPVYAYDSAGYDNWFHDMRLTKKEWNRQKKEVFPCMPLISICIPLYKTKKKFLRELMDSLLGQSYEHLEIILADGSPDMELKACLDEWYPSNKKIVYQHLEENKGISENTNAAMALAHGDYIMLCDHDDVLERNAVYEIVKAINKDPSPEVIYTDEDKLMYSEDVYFSPNFKTDWNPDLLCSNNYITHIFCVKKSIVDEVGGERSEFDGAQDYDFIFRCTERAKTIAHVPVFLYHWRAHASSTAGNPESKMYAYENGRRAIEEHYKRVGISAEVELAEDIGSYRSVYKIQGEPLVSIIIPNKDQVAALKRCLESIFTKSTYRNFEILIAENNSCEKETFAYYEEITRDHDNVRVLTWDKPFNYAAINNWAADEASGEYLIFLNNDTEVITDRWIEEMLGYAQRGDVGAVGARLYYPDDRLQHCGIVVGIGGVAGHICHLEPGNSGGYFGRVVKTQDVSAVTAACMMMPKKVFHDVGGFEEKFAVAYNDVDLCLKVRKKGLLVVYDAWCMLYHYESLSRGSDAEEKDHAKHMRQMEEAALLRSRWPEIFADGDPYFNPNLDYNAADYVLRGTIPPNYSTLEHDRIKANDHQ